jgi:hypothetical protein
VAANAVIAAHGAILLEETCELRAQYFAKRAILSVLGIDNVRDEFQKREGFDGFKAVVANGRAHEQREAPVAQLKKEIASFLYLPVNATDEAAARTWTSAVAALHGDPDAPLPK